MLDGGRRHWQGRLWVARSESAQAGRANLRSNLGTTLRAPHPCRTRANFHNFALYSATAGGKLSSSAAVLNSCAGSPSFVSTCAAKKKCWSLHTSWGRRRLGAAATLKISDSRRIRRRCPGRAARRRSVHTGKPTARALPGFQEVQPTDQQRGHKPSGAQELALAVGRTAHPDLATLREVCPTDTRLEGGACDDGLRRHLDAAAAARGEQRRHLRAASWRKKRG